jgi:GNAT superfamily N-acetyltransferase
MNDRHPDLARQRLRLVRLHLRAVPAPVFPPGFELRPFAPGDETLWGELVRAADPLRSAETVVFDRTFAGDPAERPRRLVFLRAPGGETVGTVAAWFGEADWGRVHWLMVRPGWQGRGLGRALLYWALHRLRELGHRRAFLITEAARVPALRLYLSAGFVPDPRSAAERAAWARLRGQLSPARQSL